MTRTTRPSSSAVSAVGARLIETFRAPAAAGLPTRREVIAFAVLSTALAFCVYVSHVVRGGWYVDDWTFVAVMGAADGPAGAYEAMTGLTHRPGLALSITLMHLVAGDGQALYLVIGILLTALQSWLFYLALRALRLQMPVAATAAGIFLVLPYIDASRLWFAAFPIQVAGSLYLAGLLTALRGLRSGSVRNGALWHAGAVCLYATAVLTYELIAGIVLATPLLYLVTGPNRATAARLVSDYVCVALCLVYLAPRAEKFREADASLAFLWDRANQMWTPAEQVFRSLIPWTDVLGGTFGLILLLSGVVGAILAVRRGDGSGAGLVAWAKIAGVSAVFAGAGLVMLLPADPYFIPRTTGLGNRVSAYAAFGAVLLLMAMVAVACGGLGAAVRRPRAGFAVALLVVGLVLATATARELRQQNPWAQSWSEQKEVLEAVDAALGAKARDATAVVTFRHTTFLLPADVSVFAYNWDLRGALWQTYHRFDITGHPWMNGSSSCGSAGVVFTDLGGNTTTGVGPYGYAGRLYFVDASRSTAVRVSDKRSCDAALAAMAH